MWDRETSDPPSPQKQLGFKLLSSPLWRGLKPGEAGQGENSIKNVGTFRGGKHEKNTYIERKNRAARRRRWNETAALSTSGRRRRPVHLLPFLYALMKSVRRTASFWEVAWAVGVCTMQLGSGGAFLTWLMSQTQLIYFFFFFNHMANLQKNKPSIYIF